MKRIVTGSAGTAVICIFSGFGFQAFIAAPACGPEGRLMAYGVMAFAAAAAALVWAGLYSERKIFREQREAGFLFILLLSSLYFLYETSGLSRMAQAGPGQGRASLEAIGCSALALNAATGFWAVCMAGVLLAAALSCLSATEEEKGRTSLAAAALTAAPVVVTGFTLAALASYVHFSGMPERMAAAWLVLLSSGLLVSIACFYFVLRAGNRGSWTAFSMLFIALAHFCLFAGLFLIGGIEGLRSPGRIVQTAVILFLCVGTGFVTLISLHAIHVKAGGKGGFFRFGIVTVLVIAFVFSFWKSVEVKSRAAALVSEQATGKSQDAAVRIDPFRVRLPASNLASCPGGKAAGDMNIPSAPLGFCPMPRTGDSTVLRVVEPPDLPLAELDKIIRSSKGVRELAIHVKSPAGGLRVIPLVLPRKAENPGVRECPLEKEIEFHWLPPAEDTEYPIIYPLCAGSETLPRESHECLTVRIAPAPAGAAPSGGGGCKSPNHSELVFIKFGEGGKVSARFHPEAESAELSCAGAVNTFLAGKVTLNRRMSRAVIAVIDPTAGTLQDLVDAIMALRWRNAPIVDRLWVKGWERTK
ncbi:MAG: hypothetical protein ABIJ56_05665 [Pseudomonadota bacterium]